MATRRSFLAGGVGLLGTPLLPNPLKAAGPDLASLFRNPPKSYSPVPLWWWSGEPVERKRLRWQMERFVEGGIFNVCIINLAPAGPYANAFPDSPRFFSEEWWTLFLSVCADARELGMRIWFYDQLGFSSANLTSDLVRAHTDWKGRWLNAVNGDDSSIPAGSTRLTVARGLAFYTTSSRLDTLNPAACRALVDRIHGEFERRAGGYFGDVIAGSFQDELAMMPTWSATFAQEFHARKGYDLVPYLPDLWQGSDAQAVGVRTDYQQVRSSLAEEAFFRPLFDWHTKRGMICGYDQTYPARAGDPAGATRLYGDYARTNRWYGAPGSDHGGETKIHSSFAHLYERPRVWIESFHSSGWGGTLEETFDWLVMKMRAGATLYNPHAVYYSTWGGWWEWAPPSTCWRQPYWRHYPLFSKAVTRLCAILSRGKHVAEVGVLYPTATVQANISAGEPTEAAQAVSEVYHSLVGRMDMIRARVAAGILDGDRRDFDVLDDDSITRGVIAEGTLSVAGERYRAIVLPACTVLEPRTAAALVRFVESGGTLVAAGALPEFAAGLKSDPAAVHALRRLFASGRAYHAAAAEAVPAILARLPRLVEAPVPTLMRRDGDSVMLFVPAAHPAATKFIEERGRYDFDRGRYRRNMRITVRGMRSAPELWDPLTGEHRAVEAKVVADGVEVLIPFAEGPAALLVWEPKPAAPATTRVETVVLQQIDGPWDMQLEPTMDNRFGDFNKPNGVAIPMQTWSFQHRTGDPGEWKEAHATFGTFGYRAGPMPATALPAPLAGIGADADPLRAQGWKPAEYSLSRGIYKDTMHSRNFGVRGYVPEEFLYFGMVRPGEGVQYRTSFWSGNTEDLQLAVSAPGAKQVWLDGKSVGETDGGDLCLVPVTASAGRRLLEFRVRVDAARDMRAYWALVRKPDGFARPEWMRAPGKGAVDSWVHFTTSWQLSKTPARAVIQYACEGATICGLIVNGREAGWAEPRARVQPCDVTALLRPGDNEIRVSVQETANAVPSIFADGRAELSDGSVVVLLSGGQWLVRRDEGAPGAPLLSGRRGIADSFYLQRRPHPLPEAAWLERSPADDTVIPVVPDAMAAGDRVEWLRWTLPPGAAAMSVPAAGSMQAFVDDRQIEVRGQRIELPNADALRRVCVLRVAPERGRTAGAILNGPVTYEMGAGRLLPGDWSEAGLENYSGGIWHRKRIELERLPEGEVELDIGRVRGTAEVRINGQTAGVRIWFPYRFPVTGLLRPGANLVEVLVLNTLGPYLKGHSATHFVHLGQEKSGMFGPIQLVRTGDKARQ